MLCSLYQNRFRPLLIRIREKSLALCSGPQCRLYARLPLIQTIWAPRSAFSQCFILGALACFIVHTYTVWSQAVASLQRAPSGFPAELVFSCPSECSLSCFAVCFCNIWSKPLTLAIWSSSPRWKRFETGAHF